MKNVLKIKKKTRKYNSRDNTSTFVTFSYALGIKGKGKENSNT